MTISKPKEISELIEIINSRDAKLYHACQLKDFRSYVKLGGIPSRNKLHNSGLPYTTFETDDIDKTNKVWDKVFGNFSDFGTNFARGHNNSIPNPYGPIQIVFRPDALSNATDVAVTLRSAGATDFDRDYESIKDPQDINLIYLHPKIGTNDFQKRFIAYREELNSRFKCNHAKSPEFNCSIADEIIPFSSCAYIIVDSCIYNGRPLSDEISKISPKRVINRSYKETKKQDLIEELSILSATHDCTQKNFERIMHASEHLKQWVAGRDSYHYDRFANYLRKGTTSI